MICRLNYLVMFGVLVYGETINSGVDKDVSFEEETSSVFQAEVAFWPPFVAKCSTAFELLPH